MEGWIKIHRQITNNPIWQDKPFSEGQAWIDLLIAVTYDKSFIKVKNGTRIELRRGECGYSKLTLSERWGWSRGKVNRFLKFLENENMIQQKNIANFNVIKVFNYNFFQNETTNNTTNDITNGQQTIQQTDTIKKEKKEKNDKNSFSIDVEKKKKPDPFINKTKDIFMNEYLAIMGKKVFLSHSDHMRLTELSAEYDDFKELIPIVLNKLKKIKFDEINFTPTASWLLKGNNFERVMNGEFESKKTFSRPTEKKVEFFKLSEEERKETEEAREKAFKKMRNIFKKGD